MSIGVKEIAFVGYPVMDMDRARKFYTDVLGLTESLVMDSDGDVHWVEYEIKGTTLALAKSSGEWLPHKDGAGAALEVEDLEAALAQLKEHGVEPVMPIGDFPACRISVIPDPEGNTIALHSRKNHHPDYTP